MAIYVSNAGQEPDDRDFSKPISTRRHDQDLLNVSAGPQLRPADEFFEYKPIISPDISEANTSEKVTLASEKLVKVTTPLPAAKEILDFYKLTNDKVTLPDSSKQNSSDSLSLSDMLGEASMPDPQQAPAILSSALIFWEKIDRRPLKAEAGQNTAYEVLKNKASTARELEAETKNVVRLLKTSHKRPAEDILKQFLHSIEYYRSTYGLELFQAAELTALEMVYDAGTKPFIQRPERQSGSKSDSKTTKLEKNPLRASEDKPRRKLNYGRPTDSINRPTETNIVNSTGESVPYGETLSELRALAKTESLEFNFQQETQAWEEYYELARKQPTHVGERYGIVSDSVKQKTVVDTQQVILSPFQTIANSIASWAIRFSTIAKALNTPNKADEFNLEQLNKKLELIRTQFFLYEYVIKIVDGLVPLVKNDPSLEAQLTPEDRRLIEIHTPTLAKLDIRFSGDKDANLAMVAGEFEPGTKLLINIRAMELVREHRLPELRYEHDINKRIAKATAIATQEYKEGKLRTRLAD